MINSKEGYLIPWCKIYFLGYLIWTSALSHDIRSRDLKLVNANAPTLIIA